MGDDDFDFNKLLQGVRPIEQNKITPYRKAIPAIASQRLKDNERVLQELLENNDQQEYFNSGDELRYLKDGHPPRLLKKLRRGDYSIQDELDLHGMIAKEAKPATHFFINECAQDKVRAIRIIHGKGLNSKDKKPIIKNRLLGWLSNNKHVIAVCSAPEYDGGTGAVYVLLQ